MGLWPKKFPGKMGTNLKIPMSTMLTSLPVAEPMWPFMVAGLIVAYGINAGANAMMECTSPSFTADAEMSNWRWWCSTT